MTREARQFVEETVDNLPELELLLYFGRHPHAVDDAVGLAGRLRSHPEQVQAAAESLAAKRVLRRRSGDGQQRLFYGLSRDETVRQQAVDLARACEAEEGLRESLAQRFGPVGPRWLYEQITGYLTLFSPVRTRLPAVLQFLFMGGVALVVHPLLGIRTLAVVRAMAVIVLVALLSGLLLSMARALRQVAVPLSGPERSVIRRHRGLIFHPWHLAAVPGVLLFAFGVRCALTDMFGQPSLAASWLGEPPPALLLPFMALLIWDLAYRLGVGLWVLAVSVWRAFALRSVWPADIEGSAEHVRLACRLGHCDNLLALVPMSWAAVALLLLEHRPAALGAVGMAAVTLVGYAMVRRLAPVLARPADAEGLVPRLGRQLPLEDGAEVAVIGAGPAGALFALVLQREAAKRGREVNVTIYDGKDFQLAGPPGCNMCAGVVARSLCERLADLGVELPERVVQSRVRGFRLHTLAGSVLIEPESAAEGIVTVFRGNGPRYTPESEVVSFDDYLLRVAEAHGARVVQQPVREVSLPTEPGGQVVVQYGAGDRRWEAKADLVVGAFGLNSQLGALMEGLGFGYERPEARQACNAEIVLAAEPTVEFAEYIHVFCMGKPDVSFAALTPKAGHLTMTAVGRADIKRSRVVELMEDATVAATLARARAEVGSTCHCHPKLSIRDARNIYTDRVVLVGDASCSRLYKNGLESALDTAEIAAATVLEHGVSWSALATHYYPECRRRIIDDNRYGRILYRINDIVQRSRLLLKGHLRLLREQSPAGAAMRRTLWDMFTGSRPYREILWQALGLKIQVGLLKHTLLALAQGADGASPAPAAPAEASQER